RLGITIALGIIVLAFITLIPFKIQETVGYEVAFAGVDENLVVDQQKAQMFLTQLGLDSAELEVSDCDKTCKVHVYNLKSEGEVELVITAFDEMGNSKLETVQKIKGEDNITLANHFKNVIWINDDPDGTKHEIKANKIVLTAMGETDSDSATFNIWIAKDSDSVDLSEHEIIFLDSNQYAHQVILEKSGDDSGIKYFEVTASDDPDGEKIMIFHDEDGVVHELDLNDPNLQQKIQELGLNIEIYNEGEEPEEVTEFLESGIYPSQKQESAVPDQYELKQNYPNPFNPTTDIRFAIPKPGHVKLEVYNIQGRLVRTLIDRELSAGEHIVQWDSTDDNGNIVASGTYLYRLTADDYIESKKMTLVK
nr:T9SS type A sorting domain-containing protein [Fodinibius sp.]